MGYPQPPQDPYGQSGPQYPQQQPYGHSGPQQQPYGYGGPQQPGYGYQPPTTPPPPPPRRTNTALIVLLAVGIPLLLMGGCATVVLVLGQPTSRDTLVTEADNPPDVAVPSQPEPVVTAQETQAEAPPAGTPEQQPAGTAEQPAGPSAAAVGGALTLEGRDPGLKVKVTVVKVIDPGTPDSEFMKPDAGNKFVAVEITLTNVGQTVYSDAPTNGAMLIDGEGQQYRSTLFGVREGQPLNGSATINVGDTRKGVIAFEVPESAKLAKFQFALNSGFADHKGEWNLS